MAKKINTIPFNLQLAKKGEPFCCSLHDAFIEMFYVSGDENKILFKFQYDSIWNYGNLYLCDEELKKYYHLK